MWKWIELFCFVECIVSKIFPLHYVIKQGGPKHILISNFWSSLLVMQTLFPMGRPIYSLYDWNSGCNAVDLIYYLHCKWINTNQDSDYGIFLTTNRIIWHAAFAMLHFIGEPVASTLEFLPLAKIAQPLTTTWAYKSRLAVGRNTEMQRRTTWLKYYFPSVARKQGDRKFTTEINVNFYAALWCVHITCEARRAAINVSNHRIVIKNVSNRFNIRLYVNSHCNGLDRRQKQWFWSSLLVLWSDLKKSVTESLNCSTSKPEL